MPKKKKAKKKKAHPKPKAISRKKPKKKPALKKAAKSKAAARSRKPAGEKTSPKKRPGSRKSASTGLNEALPMVKGPGARSGGQSGDLQGLSGVESADSESVEELVEEGQDYEAELVDAVENAPDPDEGELTTEVPEDDPEPDTGSFSRRNRL